MQINGGVCDTHQEDGFLNSIMLNISSGVEPTWSGEVRPGTAGTRAPEALVRGKEN